MVILTTEKISSNRSFLKICGGKAFNLFLLKEAGFHVPDFIVIPANEINKQIQGISREINLLLNNIAEHSDEDILKISEEIEKLICNFQLAVDFENEIKAEALKAFGNNYIVSVRSSALQEDKHDYSFAGQFSSFMDVSESGLLQKIKLCIASAFSARVIKYKLLNNINLNEFSIAVIVQKMITAKVSGIIFSRNVTDNLNEVLIEAGFGAGEGVVNNTTDTDSYYIDRDSRRIRKMVFSERLSLAGANENNDKISPKEVPVNSNLSVDTLSEEQVIKLSEAILKIEDLQQSPQDVEFSIDNENHIYFLQARQITTIQTDQIKIIDNTNIVESYPGITLPLSFSFALEAYKQVFTSAAGLFKLSQKQVAKFNTAVSELITHVQGRVYYNLHHWYKMVQMVVSSSENLRAWETLIGVNKKTTTRKHVSLWKKIRSAYITVSLLINYRKLIRQFFVSFNEEYSVMRNYADSMRSLNQNANQIFNFYKKHSKRLFQCWAPTIMNDFFTFKMYDLLKKHLHSYGFKDEDNIANDLLCGTDGVESEKPVICLLKMKEMVIHDNGLLALFNKSGSQIISALNNGGFPAFKITFDDYIKKYGDRILQELKLETINLRMNREILVTMIKDQLQVGATAEMIKEKQFKIRTEAEAKVASKQKWSLKTWYYKRIRKFAEEAVKNRENMRFARTRAYGVVKECFLAIGERMAEDNIIEQARDVFYLTLDDLRSYSLNRDRNDRKEIIRKRKQQFSDFEKNELPDRIMYTGEMIPLQKIKLKEMTSDKNNFHGICVSGGRVKAKAIVIKYPDIGIKIDGEILVTRMTDPGWIFLMSRAGGLISEKGSLLSHTAIVGRELGIPTMVGVAGATKNINTNDLIEMDADNGVISIIQKNKE
ncbi:MAG: PEP/pyruvate-binding domain-containing protein [Bacteroidales bacterium]|jgi:pyruvate,water dikinase